MFQRFAELASFPALAGLAAAFAFVGGFATVAHPRLDPLQTDFASALEADYAQDDVVLALPALSPDVIEAARSDAEALRILPGANAGTPPDSSDPPEAPSEQLVQADSQDAAETPATGPEVASFDLPPVIDPPGGGGTPSTPPEGGGAPATPPEGGGPPSTPPDGGGPPSTPPDGGGPPSTPPDGGGAPSTPPEGGGAPATPPEGGGAPATPPEGGGAPATPLEGGGAPATPPEGGGGQGGPP